MNSRTIKRFKSNLQNEWVRKWVDNKIHLIPVDVDYLKFPLKLIICSSNFKVH